MDEECLVTMANVIEFGRTGFRTHIYWDDLVSMEERGALGSRSSDLPLMGCVVMQRVMYIVDTQLKKDT